MNSEPRSTGSRRGLLSSLLMARLTWLLSMVALTAACGGRQVRATHRAPDPDGLEVGAFLLWSGQERASTLTPPEANVETLERATRGKRGPELRRAERDVALALLFAAETIEDEREARRMEQSARRHARAALRGNRDPYLDAEMAFVELWFAWRGGQRSADQMASRFVERHANAGELVIFAWVIQAEVAFERERYDEALRCYRYLIGMIEHPLFPLGLYRTANILGAMERDEEEREALEEARALGCSASLSPEAERIAGYAAAELGTRLRSDDAGRSRPTSCPRSEEPN